MLADRTINILTKEKWSGFTVKGEGILFPEDSEPPAWFN
jgi:hypothetical protein